MLYEDSLVQSNWLSSWLQSEVGVWMLEHPNSVEVVFEEEDYFLKSWDLSKDGITLEYRLIDVGSL